MDTFWNKKKKKERNYRKKEINIRLIKDRIIVDIGALFEQQEDYYKPKRVSNFWNNNYIEYESNGDKNRNLSLDEYLNKIIVIRNGKMVWKHGLYCWYFHLNLRYLGWLHGAYIKTAKNGDFCEELLSENDFEAVLATFCCYDHGAKASEAVQKIATDQKRVLKMLHVCYNLLNSQNQYQSITVKDGWL